MIRTMVIMILAGLTFLQGLPDGMAYNPQQCQNCPTPTPTRQHRKITPEPTIEATPNPPPTETPTPEPWTCPPIGDCTKKEYRDVCIESCELTGQNGCAGICNKCWKGE